MNEVYIITNVYLSQNEVVPYSLRLYKKKVYYGKKDVIDRKKTLKSKLL